MDVEKIIDSVVARFIGTKHERDVKRIQPLVAAINALEPEMKKLSDAQIGERTAALKAEVQARLEGLERDDPELQAKAARSARACHRAGFCAGARSGPPHAGHAPLRRAADRRNRAASGQESPR